MSQTIPTNNGKLLELMNSERALRQLYDDIRYSKFRRDFFAENEVRLQSVNIKNLKLLKEFFVMENEDGKGEKVKFETPPPIPKVEAVFKTERKVVKPKSLLSAEVTEDVEVLVTPEVPEQPQQARPVLLEGKSMADFEQAHKAWAEKDNIMKI